MSGARDAYRTVTVDAHVHTAASFDAETTPAELLEMAARADLDGVVVTDHDTTEGARIVDRVATEGDVTVITGCEVSTADGHLLAVGVADAPEPGRPLDESAESIRAQGGLAVVPHPFQRSRHGVAESDVDAVDGVEVYNALTVTGVRNNQARRFARREGYPMFGGSDAHAPTSVGSAATAVEIPADSPVSAEAILASMRAGRTRPVGEPVPAWRVLNRVVTSATLKTRSLL